VLSCGPATLGPLAATPRLVDEYLVVIHPAVVAEGRPMFAGLTADLALELRGSKVFDGGAVLLRYGVVA
jgi:dihydrofolate reductase